jgi:putative Mg2+ transporter-C (MgtC) family protein
MFTSLSVAMDAASPARIAAQVVSGVGFLGAGIILKRDDGGIANLTTAASVWFAAALGMTIGFGWYLSALAGTVFALLVTRIPHVSSWRRARDE